MDNEFLHSDLYIFDSATPHPVFVPSTIKLSFTHKIRIIIILIILI